MHKYADITTRLINNAFNIIFIGHPVRTSLGVLVGLCLYTSVNALNSGIQKDFEIIFDIAKISSWQFIILGVTILHIPTIFYYMSKKGNMLSENEEKALELIRQARSEGVPEKYIANLYIKLCEKVLSNVEQKRSEKKELERTLRRT
jgi:hypothetical protein